MTRLGWQKVDVTSTVRHWYADSARTRLRFLVDCSGCGDHVNIHLFNDSSGTRKSTKHNSRKSKQSGKSRIDKQLIITFLLLYICFLILWHFPRTIRNPNSQIEYIWFIITPILGHLYRSKCDETRTPTHARLFGCGAWPVLQAKILCQLRRIGLGRLDYCAAWLLCKLLPRQLQRSTHTRQLSFVSQPRNRRVPQNESVDWLAAVLHTTQILQHVTHLLRRESKDYQTRFTKNGRRRVWMPLIATLLKLYGNTSQPMDLERSRTNTTRMTRPHTKCSAQQNEELNRKTKWIPKKKLWDKRKRRQQQLQRQQ